MQSDSAHDHVEITTQHRVQELSVHINTILTWIIDKESK